MSTNVKAYSADQVALTIAGRIIESGFAEDEFITIEPNADDFTDVAGADGEVARARTNDRRATVKLKLLQTSDGNTLLSQLRALALATPNGADVGVLEVVDRSSGRTIIHADKSWIQKPPSPSRARGVKENEWTLRCAHANWDFGGSPSI